MSNDFDLIHWVNVVRNIKTERDLYQTFEHVSRFYEQKACTHVQYEELRDAVFEKFKSGSLIKAM